MTSADEQIAHLTQIIKSNRLHEEHCAAFSTLKGDFAGMFQGMAEKECHCWLDKDTTSGPGTGFGHYNQETKQIEQRCYDNRYYAYRDLIDTMGFSEDKESAEYWWKHYMIIPVTLKTTES